MQNFYTDLHSALSTAENWRDNDEVVFYFMALLERLILFADQKYSPIEIENAFSGLLIGYGRAEATQGFKRGIEHMAKMCSADLTEITAHEAAAAYESAHPDEVDAVKKRRAALAQK